MPRPSLAVDEERIVEWIVRNARDGYAPTLAEYGRSAVAAGLPSEGTLYSRGLEWRALAERAGLLSRATNCVRVVVDDQALQGVVDWIRTHARPDGSPPTRDEYLHCSAEANLPSVTTLASRGYRWRSLVERAGLEDRSKRYGYIRRLDRLEREIGEMQRRAQPARPSYWPLTCIPTRTVVRIWRRADGSIIQTTTEYRSIR